MAETSELLKSLETFVNSLRGDFETYHEKAKKKKPEAEYSFVTQRSRTRSVRITAHEGPAADTVHQDNDKFRIEVYNEIIASLDQGIKTRSAAYDRVNNRFAFLVQLNQMSNESIKSKCEELAAFYDQDLDAHDLYLECLQFVHYLNADLKDREANSSGRPLNIFTFFLSS